MQLHNQPQSNFDPPGALAPWLWYGDAAVDGTARPFCNAPQGSMYWYLQSGTVTVCFRAALNNTTADWVQVLHMDDINGALGVEPRSRTENVTVRAGLGWAFGAAPVVARY